MYGLQPDLLGCIAAYLSGQDLGNFRLVCQNCYAGASGARGDLSWSFMLATTYLALGWKEVFCPKLEQTIYLGAALKLFVCH